MRLISRRTALRVASRIALAAITVVFVMTFLFILIQLAPGDPVSYRFKTGASLTAEQYAELRHRVGLDRPLIQQYFSYMGDLLRGDLGKSFTYGGPVLDLILSRFPGTLILMLPSMMLGALVGTFVGALSARNPDRLTDNVIRTATLMAYSIPIFWLGIVLVQLFVLRLGLFPSAGMIDPNMQPRTFEYYTSVVWHAVLPILTLSTYYVALFARYSRTSLLKESSENYILTARAKGLTASMTFRRHVVRNGLLPLVTLAGLAFRTFFGGAVYVETVFSWPGIGLMLYNAILARDFPVIEGVFLFAVTSVIVFNLLVDLVYGYVDPRVRTGA